MGLRSASTVLVWTTDCRVMQAVERERSKEDGDGAVLWVAWGYRKQKEDEYKDKVDNNRV